MRYLCIFFLQGSLKLIRSCNDLNKKGHYCSVDQFIMRGTNNVSEK